MPDVRFVETDLDVTPQEGEALLYDAVKGLWVSGPVAVDEVTPGGSDTHVQFNDGGVFGGDSAFTWDNTNKRLQVANITTPGTELVLEQTGDQYGTTRLRLRGRDGTTGAILENVTLDVLDFCFLPSSGAQANFRWEHRSTALVYSSNSAGEFHYVFSPNLGFHVPLVVGDAGVIVGGQPTGFSQTYPKFSVGGNPLADTLVSVLSYSALQKGLVIKGAASQFANLQEWQEVGGTVMASLSIVSLSTVLTLGYGGVGPQIKFNYGASSGGDFTSQLSGVDQLSFGFNNTAAFGGTVNTSSGRLLYFYDRVGAAYCGAIGPNQDFYWGTSNTAFSVRLLAPADGNIPLTVKGTASQTANLQEWQNSGGTTVAAIKPNGAIVLPSTVVGSTAGGGMLVNNGSSTVATFLGLDHTAISRSFLFFSTNRIFNGSAWEYAAYPARKGGSLQVEDDVLRFYTVQASSLDFEIVFSVVDKQFVLGVGEGAAKLHVLPAAAERGCVIQGAASQSANLQEWQNSSGTALCAIKPDGSWQPPSLADASATNNSLYYSTTASKLVYKDSGGVVNALY